MISPALHATLTNLKTNRLLSGKAKSALDPFIGKTFALPLVFVSASRTFGNPFDPVYDDGHTLVCRLEGEEIEVTVLLGAEENDRVDSLASNETFEAKLTVLDFDALYQRAIFGQLLASTSVTEEQEEVTEEPQTQIPQEPEALPASSIADVPPFTSQPAETLPPEPEETPQSRDTSENPYPPQEAEIEIPASVAPPPPPPPSPSSLDNIHEVDSEVKTCPKGHGPLEPMAGKMICWTCGWPEHKKSELISTHSSKSNRLQKDLDWIRNKGKKAEEEQSVNKPTKENKGCSGCRIILGSLFLLISLGTCTSGSVGGGFVFLLLGLSCYWPMMKKWFSEGLNDSNS